MEGYVLSIRVACAPLAIVPGLFPPQLGQRPQWPAGLTVGKSERAQTG